MKRMKILTVLLILASLSGCELMYSFNISIDEIEEAQKSCEANLGLARVDVSLIYLNIYCGNHAHFNIPRD